MDSYEFNKIAGWVLAAAVAVLGLALLTSAFYPVHNPEPTAYEVQGVEVESAGGGAAAAQKPIAFYLQKADPAKGEQQFKKCAACHTVTKGGPDNIGPNLYGVLGGPHAHRAGFPYSAAMLETKGKIWDWDAASHWVDNPKSYIPGNKMSFAGISKPEDRANLLAYLNSQSDHPLPIPAAPAEEAAAAPADAPAEAKAAEVAPGAEGGKAAVTETRTVAKAETGAPAETPKEPAAAK